MLSIFIMSIIINIHCQCTLNVRYISLYLYTLNSEIVSLQSLQIQYWLSEKTSYNSLIKIHGGCSYCTKLKNTIKHKCFVESKNCYQIYIQ